MDVRNMNGFRVRCGKEVCIRKICKQNAPERRTDEKTSEKGLGKRI